MQTGSFFNVSGIFASVPLLVGVGNLVTECLRLCDIQVKLLLM